MKTTRTISNISYNTDDYFQATIERLKDRGVIEWCYWIRHKAEDDELKSHIHFVLRPSGRLETAALEKEFKEIVPGESKPLGCTSKWHFTPESNLDDWLLYAVHDVPYLASKGQFRKHHYELEEMRATDYDALREDWNNINRAPYLRLKVLQEAVQNRTPFPELVQQGVIPIAQRAQYERQYMSLFVLQREKETHRKEAHEEIPEEFKQVLGEEYEQLTFDE